MAMRWEFKLFSTTLIVILLLVSPIFAYIEFYNDPNFKGLLHQADTITTSCETLPDLVHNKASSIKTSKCVVIYSHPNCAGRSFRVEAGDISTLPYFNDDIDSYHACDDVSASSNLKDVRVKLYGQINYANLLLDTPIVDGCRPLANNLHNKAMSIKTDVCIILYSHNNCVGAQFRLEPGSGATLPYFNTQVDSFHPCNVTDVRNGFRLQTKIIKFEIRSEQWEVDKEAKTGATDMSHQTCFWNNASSIITQHYSVSKIILEKVELETSNNFFRRHPVSVSPTAGFESSAGIPSQAKEKIYGSLKAGYEYMNQNSGSDRYINETQKTFTVSQNIEVQPCTMFKIAPFVKTMEDYPVRYKVFAEVTGNYDNGPQLSTSELIQKLSGLKFESTKDSYTIVASSESSLKVNYAFDAVIVVNGRPIENCSRTRSLFGSVPVPMDLLGGC